MLEKDYEDFINAVRWDNLQNVKRLCRTELIEKEGKDGRRAIHLACQIGHVEVVSLLLENLCELEAADNYKRKPIHLACAYGHSDIVQILFEYDCRMEDEDGEGRTPLDLAKQYHKYDCVKKIEELQNSPAYVFVAARKDDLKMFQKIRYPLWTKEHETDKTLLDIILQHNSKAIIEAIMCMSVPDKDIKDFISLGRNGFSDESYELLRQWLVHCCVRHSIDWAFMFLCRADAVNSSLLLDGRTCLDTAVEHRRSLCVRHILHRYVNIDYSWDRASNTAYEKGYEEIVELIQQRKLALQRNLSMGRNRLHMAVIEGDLDMIEYLQWKGIANNSDQNQEGDTPLMMAVANRMDECAQAIKQHSTDVDVVNKHGQTVLHTAVTCRMDALPEWIIREPCQMEQLDCMGLTALQQAVAANLEGVAAQLVAMGANHRSVIPANFASLQLQKAIFKSLEHLRLTAHENSSSLCLKLHGRIYPCFLEKFTTDDANFLDGNEKSLLHLAALLMDVDSCRKLLEKGAVIDCVNKDRNTPMMELLVHLCHLRSNGLANDDDNAVMTMRCLIDGGANIANENGSGKAALQMAIEYLDEKLLLEMVRRDPPIKQLTQDEFDKCVEKEMFQFLEKIVPKLSEKMAREYITADAIRLCMQKLADSTVKLFFNYATPDVLEDVVGEVLYEAARRNEVEYFLDILRLHKTKWKQMTNGESILTVLIREKKWSFCETLLQTGTVSKLLELTDANGNSPLMVAIEMEAGTLIDSLIAEGDAVNSENSDGDTALSMLFKKVSSATGDELNQLQLRIKNLINASADIYHVNKHNKAAISFCVSKDLRKEFETFYKKRANKLRQCPTCRVP